MSLLMMFLSKSLWHSWLGSLCYIGAHDLFNCVGSLRFYSLFSICLGFCNSFGLNGGISFCLLLSCFYLGVNYRRLDFRIHWLFHLLAMRFYLLNLGFIGLCGLFLLHNGGICFFLCSFGNLGQLTSRHIFRLRHHLCLVEDSMGLLQVLLGVCIHLSCTKDLLEFVNFALILMNNALKQIPCIILFTFFFIVILLVFEGFCFLFSKLLNMFCSFLLSEDLGVLFLSSLFGCFLWLFLPLNEFFFVLF